MYCIAVRDRWAGQLRARSMPTTTFQTSCRRDVRTKRRGGSDRNNNNNNNNNRLVWADASKSTAQPEESIDRSMRPIVDADSSTNLQWWANTEDTVLQTSYIHMSTISWYRPKSRSAGHRLLNRFIRFS